MDVQVHINYLAVAVAAIASYIIAFLWYAVVFKNQWMKLTGITEMKPSAKTVILALVGAWFTSWVLDHATIFGNAYLHTAGVSGGLMCGFFNWLGFFAPVTMMSVLYEKRPWKLWILDNGFWLCSLLVMGAILSSWV
ncbi:MAG TPA: DUF1761 domain-containing protein [Bacteroidota bacterium]|nr:DUF1761 domain-containing protein [Bacteroidota bacterium]